MKKIIMVLLMLFSLSFTSCWTPGIEEKNKSEENNLWSKILELKDVDLWSKNIELKNNNVDWWNSDKKNEFENIENIKKMSKGDCWNFVWKMKNICLENYYTNLAMSKKDSSFCDNITDLKWKNNCKSSLEIEKIISWKDDSWCDNLDISLRWSCKDEVLVNSAIKKMDKSICDKIIKNDTKDNCNKILDTLLWNK